jgi:hypothetical protein
MLAITVTASHVRHQRHRTYLSFLRVIAVSLIAEGRMLSRWTALVSFPAILSYQSIQITFGTPFLPGSFRPSSGLELAERTRKEETEHDFREI